MKEIAILLPSLRGGGVEKEMLILANELAKRGADLDLVVVNTMDSTYSTGTHIHLVNLNSGRIRFALYPLTRYLLEAQPKVMLTAQTMLNSLAIMARMLTSFPARLIVSEHNHLSSVSKNATRLGDRMRPSLARLLYRYADEVVAVSHGVADDLMVPGRDRSIKIRVLHNMFDINEIRSQATAEPENPWMQESQTPIIINMGRLSPQKDQATLIKAFAILREKRDARLLILGEGSERATLERLARALGVQGEIFMPGFLSNPFAYLARANLFVLSSAWEGLPGALIEALACGIPVVSTDCPSGPAEILADGKYGMLTPPGDANALADAISKTLDTTHSSETLRQRAMDFSIERLLPQYLDLLQPSASSKIRRA